jgi:putative Ca2+/H+ antiporter (TMEM165/GDT1 family)
VERTRESRYSSLVTKVFLTVFVTIFLAEIGDKTQLATVLFAAEAQSGKWVVFAGAALALVLAAAIGVLIGAQLERFVSPGTLKLIAGAGFIAIGIWTIASR